MTRRTIAVLFMMLFTLGLWADSAKGADAPTLEDLKKLPVVGPLGLHARGKIINYVEFWVEQMKKAKNVKDIAKARKALVAGYEAHNSPPWRVAYAEISAEKMPVLLGLSDRVKQIQASMAIALMPQYTIQPALEKMARHKNPAVRYWAARGYRSSARRIMLYPERTRKMCVTLERLGRKDSGPVLAVVLQTLSIHPGSGADVITLLTSTMDKVWLARRRDLRTGNSNVIEAYRRTIVFLTPLDKKNGKRILQLLADALESASRGFAESAGRKKSAQQPWIDLLVELESKLANFTRTENTPVQDILAEAKKPIPQKAAEIRLKVLEYWRPTLAKLGVKSRPAPVPKTKPAKTAPTK